MTRIETEDERDHRVGANLTSQLVNKTVAKITMVDASDGRHGDSCYGRMSFEFTDGTFFVIDEIGQAGGMRYDVVPAPTPSHLEQAMNAVIDHVINETLATANVSIMNDEDVVAYLNAKYDSAAAYRKTPHAESLADAIRYTNAVNRLRASKK